MNEAPIVISLCDRTGVMVYPWLAAGYECWIVDVQHESGVREASFSVANLDGRSPRLMRVGADIRQWLPPRRKYIAAFAFPPCTDQAVSGARWFKDKGLAGLAGAPFSRGISGIWNPNRPVFGRVADS